MLRALINLTKDLITIPSISPNDLGCQDIISKRLLSMGFIIEKINIEDTSNLWAYRKGKTNKNFTFLGHTDVVPAGNLKSWKFPAFKPTIHKKMLFGRGSVDMKGAIAAMVIALEHFITIYPHHNNRLSVLLTSDEESKATNGTVKVVDRLAERNEIINYCIVGEPTSINVVGDTIKNGRRGSLTANLIIYGIQGHIAYPELANNPIHNIIPFLHDILKKKWDNKTIFFSETTLQISQINSGLEVNNMIPDNLFVQFNFRFGPQINIEYLKLEINSLLNFYNLKYSIDWVLSAIPFVTNTGKLLDTVCNVIKDCNGIYPKISTEGGTSDGRFITRICPEIIELGLINKTIHKANEYVKINDLYLLSKIYFNIMKKIAT